ncbi:MAG: plasmid pRiA4b ORF-3 family protein [Calditrichaeota bacterium]|nr:plasmid pRiA4b ORF-3 family protein [Calditrichota bacterium]
MAKKTTPKKIYQLKITLLGSDPPIWRRIQIRSDIKLSDLHDVLQDVMGWYDAHLHQFIHDSIYYGDPSLDDFEPIEDETKVRLDELLTRVRSKLIYEYDFGDSWEHEVRVEKVLSPDPNTKYPVCLEGERACPPEDCGGVWGYADMLKILANPKDPEYEEWLEWVGDDFDPEEFDVDEVNEILK